MMFTGLWTWSRWWYRYYFVRRKASLSSILWQQILRRQNSTSGRYPLSIAWTEPDAALEINCGAPGDNPLAIRIYDGEGRCVDTVRIGLSYLHAFAIDQALIRAHRISRASDHTLHRPH